MAQNNDSRPPAQKKADLDNHSNQLNPNNPEYQRSRTQPNPAPPPPPAKK